SRTGLRLHDDVHDRQRPTLHRPSRHHHRPRPALRHPYRAIPDDPINRRPTRPLVLVAPTHHDPSPHHTPSPRQTPTAAPPHTGDATTAATTATTYPPG